MKVIFVILTLFYSGVVSSTIESVIRNEWIEFKLEHEKFYDSLAEEEYRLQIYLDNRQFIAKHNQRFALGLETYEMGSNQFSDLTYEEFLGQYTGAVTHANTSSTFKNVADSEQFFDNEETDLTAFDWRTKFSLSPVRDQKSCGSCWAFAALTTLEHHLRIKKRWKLDLSEQQLVDCSRSYQNNGCGGGGVDRSYDYIKKYGITTERQYPYTAQDGNCRYQGQMKAVSVQGFVNLAHGENEMQGSLQRNGPLAVYIHVSNEMQHYKSGIFDHPNCPKNINHAVVIVGFGELNGHQYWTVQNSWGKTFGDNGFILMSKNKDNQCGISSYVFYPQL